MPIGRINQTDGQSFRSASPVLAVAMVEVLITCDRMGTARMEYASCGRIGNVIAPVLMGLGIRLGVGNLVRIGWRSFSG